MTDPVRIASIGLGQIARHAQLPAQRSLGGLVQTVGVYDDHAGTTLEVAQEYQVRAYTSLEQLLGDDDVTAVDVAVPPLEQPLVVSQALAAGKHVFAQKPLAVSVVAAERLVEQAESAGLQLAVNQQLRYTGLIERVSAQPKTAVSEFSALTYLPVTVDGLPNWFAMSPRKTILFNSLHFIDAAIFIMGPPLTVSASVEPAAYDRVGEQTVDVRIEFSDHRFARVSEMRAGGGSPACLIRIDVPPNVALGRMGIWDHYPAPSPDSLWFGVAGVLAHGGGPDWMPDAFRASLRDFVVGVTTGAPMPHSGRSHLAALRAVEAAYASAQRGGVVVAVS